MNITINTFEMGTDKEAALKPLEEAAEVFGAWQEFDHYSPRPECYADGYPDCTKDCRSHCETYKDPRSYEVRRNGLADEIADCVQACANLADRYHIDLAAAMERCEQRNRERGRYD